LKDFPRSFKLTLEEIRALKSRYAKVLCPVECGYLDMPLKIQESTFSLDSLGGSGFDP
jgi:hypothetical protein